MHACPSTATLAVQAATPGCTKEACKFRDSYGKFKDAGAEVFGISADTVEANSDFAKVQVVLQGVHPCKKEPLALTHQPCV
jgi:alkyl hydroperoxide reductase subunit AhpC